MPDGGDLSASEWCFFAAMTFIVFIVAISPIATEGIWWNLARGRAVLEGSLAPSSDLLTLDIALEADWLSGVPGYLLYSFLGATALMLCRLTTAFCFAYFLYSQAGSRAAIGLVLATAVGFLLCEQSFDVGPDLFDLVAVICAVTFCSRLKSTANLWMKCLTLFLCVAVSANFAPRIVFVLSVFCVNLGDGKLSRRATLSLLGAAVLGCCMTPRGWLTLVDSAILVCPWLAEEHWALASTSWRPLDVTAWHLQTMVFCLASAVYLRQTFFRCRAQDFLALLAIQAVTWPCLNNLPIASAWLVSNIVLATNPGKDRPQKPTVGRLASTGAIALTCLVLWLGFPVTKMGWGINDQLDYRLVQLSLQDAEPLHQTPPGDSALCESQLGAGMISWLQLSWVRAQDTPQRALLHGRLKTSHLLLDDLRHDRHHSYWRNDGTRGGAWLELAHRQTRLLLVSAGDIGLIHGLERGIWKPMAIDSPVLPYGRAGDPGTTHQIIEALAARDEVETGHWVYTSPVTTASHFDRDRFGFRPEVGSVGGALRQARVFRAMNLHRAAAKVLVFAAARWDNRDLQAELARNQRELAHEELLQAGRPSLFRQLTLQHAIAMTDTEIHISSELHPTDSSPLTMQPAVQNYLIGRPDLAILQLTEDTPESLYAAACLSVELGRTSDAISLLQRILQSDVTSSVRKLAQQLHSELTL